MGLYQEIILLNHFALKHTKFVVENVRPYYEPLIQPTKKLHRHLYWANFKINDFEVISDRIHSNIVGTENLYGFNISQTDIKDKRKTLRNMVDPDLGLHIFNCARGVMNKINPQQVNLFD